MYANYMNYILLNVYTILFYMKDTDVYTWQIKISVLSIHRLVEHVTTSGTEDKILIDNNIKT